MKKTLLFLAFLFLAIRLFSQNQKNSYIPTGWALEAKDPKQVEKLLEKIPLIATFFNCRADSDSIVNDVENFEIDDSTMTLVVQKKFYRENDVSILIGRTLWPKDTIKAWCEHRQFYAIFTPDPGDYCVYVQFTRAHVSVSVENVDCVKKYQMNCGRITPYRRLYFDLDRARWALSPVSQGQYRLSFNDTTDFILLKKVVSIY